jgi:hypothetical protein
MPEAGRQLVKRFVHLSGYGAEYNNNKKDPKIVNMQ